MDWKNQPTRFINFIYNKLFLSRCYLCETKNSKTLCTHCIKSLPRNTQSCPSCKQPLSTQSMLCGRCQTNPPSYHYCVAPYRFEGIIKTLIHKIKFNQKTYYIRPITYLLCKELVKEYQSKSWPDQLLYIPSHPNRIKERGFCQTHAISQQLIKDLHTQGKAKQVKLSTTNPIKKIKNTQALHSLNKKERQESSKNNYRIDQTVAKHVALFDDVMTTGSTIEQCTKLLLKSGAERVDVWVIARTPDKEH